MESEEEWIGSGNKEEKAEGGRVRGEKGREIVTGL